MWKVSMVRGEVSEEMHIKIRMEVFGEEYWADEMTYGCTKLKTVHKVQEALAEALMKLNNVEDLKKVEEK